MLQIPLFSKIFVFVLFQNPFIAYANNYHQETPNEAPPPAPSRRLIEQPKNNVDKQTTRHSNVFLPIEHRQVEAIKPQRLIPEEQLLKLIEDELAARGFPLASRPFPTAGQSQQHQIQSSPQNIVAEIANKAKEVLPTYRAHPGNFVPIHYQPFGPYNNPNIKLESKINNIDKSLPTPKVEETKQIPNLNLGQRVQQKNFQPSALPPFLENYNFIPFAQLTGYSTTPQPSKAAFTTATPKQFVSENRLLKSTAPQTFIGFNDNQNKQITASTPRNNPYFSSQQYINPYIESIPKKLALTKKDAIVAGPIYPSKNQAYFQDEYSNRNQQIPPSHSSIFVSQETGSSQDHVKSTNKKQYKLPNLGNKPLSPEEFQALVDAGYPVTAVPVPVPVPYDEYVKQQQRLIEIPLKPKQQGKISQQSKLHNFLEPVHIQQQKQQEHNGGTVVSQNL